MPMYMERTAYGVMGVSNVIGSVHVALRREIFYLLGNRSARDVHFIKPSSDATQIAVRKKDRNNANMANMFGIKLTG